MVMALINKPSYAELMENGPIDIAIPPQTITIGAILEHVRRGDVAGASPAARRRWKDACDGRSSPIAARRSRIDLPKARSALWCAAAP
jgi:trk system potassium uptake protein TrkA